MYDEYDVKGSQFDSYCELFENNNGAYLYDEYDVKGSQFDSYCELFENNNNEIYNNGEIRVIY